MLQKKCTFAKNKFRFMVRKILIISVLCVLCTMGVHLQAQVATSRFVVLDKKYDSGEPSAMKSFLDSLKTEYDARFGEVIAVTECEMDKEPPQNLLSNFLVDATREIANSIFTFDDGRKVDIALLNFGGLRILIPKGNVTTAQIFSVMPFDNNVFVVIDIKGSELRKVFFTNLRKLEHIQCFSNVKMTYRDGLIESVLVGNQPIDDDRVYRLATINFVETGGDKILQGVEFRHVADDPQPYRSHVIDYIKAKKVMKAELDDRVVVY